MCTEYWDRPHLLNFYTKINFSSKSLKNTFQGIGIKGREMALVWHNKASRTALQTSSVSHTHTLLVQTHSMTTVKEIAEQCRLRCSTILFVKSRTTHKALMKSAQFFFFIPFKYSLCIFFILLNKFLIITKNFIEFLKFNTCAIF